MLIAAIEDMSAPGAFLAGSHVAHATYAVSWRHWQRGGASGANVPGCRMREQDPPAARIAILYRSDKRIWQLAAALDIQPDIIAKEVPAHSFENGLGSHRQCTFASDGSKKRQLVRMRPLTSVLESRVGLPGGAVHALVDKAARCRIDRPDGVIRVGGSRLAKAQQQTRDCRFGYREADCKMLHLIAVQHQLDRDIRGCNLRIPNIGGFIACGGHAVRCSVRRSDIKLQKKLAMLVFFVEKTTRISRTEF